MDVDAEDRVAFTPHYKQMKTLMFTHAPISHFIYNLGKDALQPVGGRQWELASEAAGHWKKLQKPTATTALRTILKIKLPAPKRLKITLPARKK